MKRIKYVTPRTDCVPMSTEAGIMETVSQKKSGAPVVNDGTTELGAKRGGFFGDSDENNSSESGLSNSIWN